MSDPIVWRKEDGTKLGCDRYSGYERTKDVAFARIERTKDEFFALNHLTGSVIFSGVPDGGDGDPVLRSGHRIRYLSKRVSGE